MTRRIWNGVGFALCAGLLGASAPPAPSPDLQRAEHAPPGWVQLVGEGAEVRSVAPEGRCPSAEIDGRPRRMSLRILADAGFPAVCSLRLPGGVHRVELSGERLPLPIGEPRRIVIFGDTGCRLKGDDIQACDNPNAWPFAQVARLAAARRPDLVIHVGDYYYRESPCPAGYKGCAGSPYGDNWRTWNAEFFTPAAPLLRAAPWVMVRGNHETCSRGGPGWFRLLDASTPAKTCPARSDPFAINLGGLELYVLDSADTVDRSAPPPAVAGFASQLKALQPMLAHDRGWIVTHRPIWGLAPVARVGPIGPLNLEINATEQAAAKGADLGAVQMVVSGHIHHFGSFDFGPSRPAQLIVGTGGDIGEPADTPRIQTGQVRVDGADADRLSFDRFGYLVLDRAGEGGDWSGVFYDVHDRAVVDCRLHDRSLHCAPATP